MVRNDALQGKQSSPRHIQLAFQALQKATVCEAASCPPISSDQDGLMHHFLLNLSFSAVCSS